MKIRRGCNFRTFSIFLHLAFLFRLSQCQDNSAFLPKILNTLKVGTKLALTFLNVEQSDVLYSVFDKLSNGNGVGSQENDDLLKYLPFLLRLMGLDSSKAENYVFDGMVLLTHLISLTLANDDNPSRQQRTSPLDKDFSPFQYLMKHPKVNNLLTHMKDPHLLDYVLKESTEKLKEYPRENVECIPLLVCKMHPFVRGMQRSLRFFTQRGIFQDANSCYRNSTNYDACQEEILWEKADSDERMFFFIPSLNEVIKHGDECDERFPKCIY